MRYFITALSTLALAFSLSACGGNDCDTLADETKECIEKLDCTAKMGAEKTTCEARKMSLDNASNEPAVECTDALAALAAQCIGKLDADCTCQL